MRLYVQPFTNGREGRCEWTCSPLRTVVKGDANGREELREWTGREAKGGKSSELVVVLAVPGGFDLEAEGVFARFGRRAVEEVAGVDGDAVTLYGHFLENALLENRLGSIEGRDGHAEDACLGMRNGIDFELLLARSDVEVDGLLAVDTTIARDGAEGATASRVVEFQALDVLGEGLCLNESEHGDDTAKGDVVGLGLIADVNLGIVGEGVGEEVAGEGDLIERCHGGGCGCAMSDDGDLVGALWHVVTGSSKGICSKPVTQKVTLAGSSEVSGSIPT